MWIKKYSVKPTFFSETGFATFFDEKHNWYGAADVILADPYPIHKKYGGYGRASYDKYYNLDDLNSGFVQKDLYLYSYR